MKLVYPIERGNVTYNIDPGTVTDEKEDDDEESYPGIIAGSNFHREFDGNNESVEEIGRFIDNYQEDWEEFGQFSMNFFPDEWDHARRENDQA